MSTKWDTSSTQKGKILVFGKSGNKLVNEAISLPLDSKWVSFTKTFTVGPSDAG
jgi:hypothetical protein